LGIAPPIANRHLCVVDVVNLSHHALMGMAALSTTSCLGCADVADAVDEKCAWFVAVAGVISVPTQIAKNAEEPEDTILLIRE
jgi:hypothetical protein